MLNKIKYVVGAVVDKLMRCRAFYADARLRRELGAIGPNSFIGNGFEIVGAGNIRIGKNVSIRQGAVMTALNARITIGDSVIVANDLVISTGNHVHDRLGKRMAEITNAEKGPGYDRDVVVEDDVWLGARVTILNGVTVGRGSIVGAGAVVTKDTLPYSINLGVPAKCVGFRFSIEDILRHEEKLYTPDQRIPEATLRKNLS